MKKNLILLISLLIISVGIISGYNEQTNNTIIENNNFYNDIYLSTANFLKNKESLKGYGFLINVSPYQNLDAQTNICKLINTLFKENVTVFWICENITVLSKSMDAESEIINRSFEKGTFIVPFTNNSNLNSIITIIVKEYNNSKNVEIYHLNEPIKKLKINILIEPKIAHYDRKGINWEAYFKCLYEAGFSNQKVLTTGDILNNLTIDNFNVFIIGGQNISENEICEYFKLKSFFANWKIRKYVNSGGGFIGSCAGGLKAASGYKRPVGLPVSFSWIVHKFIPFQIRIVDRPIYLALPGGGGSMSQNNCSGVILKIVNQSCPVSFGLPDIINETNYWGGPMFLERKDGSPNSENLAIIEMGIQRELLFPISWFRIDLGIKSLETLELWEKIKNNAKLRKALERYEKYITSLVYKKFKFMASTDQIGTDFEEDFYEMSPTERRKALRDMAEAIRKLTDEYKK